MENKQIKRDIQVLIDSYENYKEETGRRENELRCQLGGQTDDFERQLAELAED
jgi:hypothetical protein